MAMVTLSGNFMYTFSAITNSLLRKNSTNKLSP